MRTLGNGLGPWPGLEPGPAGPQPTVLTATLPQPCEHPRCKCISSLPRNLPIWTESLKRCSQTMPTMARVFGVILIVIGLACQVAADTPVGSEQHPVFDGQLVSESWTITSTTGFSDEAAAYSSVSIDQGSLNFTHSRPSSTSDYTSYATVSELSLIHI